MTATSLSLVLVLLPPSQGKASPDRGRRAGLSTLVYSRLREPRERLIDAVDPGLRTAPAIPAAELYTGVLFAALGLADLPWDGVLIASALWGVVRPGDRIPAYRLDMSAKPSGIGGLAAYWRRAAARGVARSWPGARSALRLLRGGVASAPRCPPRRPRVHGGA